MITARSSAAASTLAVCAVLASPAAALLLSVTLLTRSSPLEFRPFLNDEVYYWHQIATAAEAGLDGGYYTVEERTTPDGRFRFGPHGPVFPLLYGSLARVFGWHRASAPLFNVAWITACAAVFMMLARLPQPRLWLAAAVLATFWPLHFWAASNMQESFHHGLSLLLAGAFLAMQRRERAGIALAGVALAIAILTRLSWSVLLPGAFLLLMRRRTPGRIAVAAVAAALVAAAAVIVFRQLAPPMPGAFGFLRIAGLEEGLAAVGSNIRDNLRRLANASDDFDPLELVHRFEYLAVTAAVAGGAAWTTLRQRSLASPEATHLVVQALNLAGIVAAMILLYALSNWSEHRVVSAHFLLAAMVLTAVPGRFGPAVALLVVAANVAAAPVYAASFREVRRDNFAWDRRSLRVFEEQAAVHMQYRAGDGPWCNTILSSQYPPDFVAVPPGIGISITRETDQMAWPPRSRYLLLDPPALALVGGRLNARPLATLPYGTLYLNLDAGCPGDGPRSDGGT